MADWTIEFELMAAQNVSSTAEALQIVGLIDSQTEPFEIVELSPWKPGGSETYIYEFLVRCAHGSKHLIAKACVVPPGSGSLQSIVDEWIRRREILAAAGVSAPRLYAVHRATLIEEFVPYSLVDALVQTDNKDVILENLGSMIGVLTRLGFPTLGVSDVRSRGTDVVWIDFGSDLGPPDQMPVFSATILEDAISYLERSGVELSAEHLKLISKSFESSLGQ